MNRITKQNVITLAERVVRLAEERGLLAPGADVRLAAASPANGIQWRLTAIEHPNGGLITLDFLPDGGHLGLTAREAHQRLTMTAAAIKAFPKVPEHDHQMGVECWCGHTTPRRAVLA